MLIPASGTNESVASGGTAAAPVMGLKPASSKGLKPKNHAVHDNFEETQNSDGTYDINCKHCSSYSKTLRTLNATKLRNHSVLGCEGLTRGQKRKIEASSQAINSFPGMGAYMRPIAQ